MLPRVEGKPFEADCDTSFAARDAHGETKASRTTGIIARDSAGRRFQQQDTAPQDGDEKPEVCFDSESGGVILRLRPRLATIYDPVGNVCHWIDRANGTTMMSFPMTLDQSGQYGSDVPTMEIGGMSVPVPVGFVPQSGVSIIGQQVIEGMDCTGYRSTAGLKMEYWVADELQETILTRLDVDGKQITQRLYNIRRNEPDPQLFVIPALDQRPVSVGCRVVGFNDEDRGPR